MLRIVTLLFYAIYMVVGDDKLSGFYKTHIGSDGRQSIVEFFQKDGKYYAYGFANVDGSPAKKDINNKNPRLRNRYDRATIFVYGLQGDGDYYKGGKVYHFRTGETYNARVKLKDNTLILRGSIDSAGIIGIDKVWTRLSDEEIAPYLHLKPTRNEVLTSLKDWEE